MAEQTFNEFTKQARIEFVNYINSIEWNNELRTKCEDLLIAYDQMKAKCDGMKDSNENSGLHLQRVVFNEADNICKICNKPIRMQNGILQQLCECNSEVEVCRCVMDVCLSHKGGLCMIAAFKCRARRT